MPWRLTPPACAMRSHAIGGQQRRSPGRHASRWIGKSQACRASSWERRRRMDELRNRLNPDIRRVSDGVVERQVLRASTRPLSQPGSLVRDRGRARDVVGDRELGAMEDDIRREWLDTARGRGCDRLTPEANPSSSARAERSMRSSFPATTRWGSASDSSSRKSKSRKPSMNRSSKRFISSSTS